ncbi:hypothetical protein ACFQGT_04130 [Natrialbaceae archaeon GCM10025810]|uniref:hypothetical protein n=1 Tax=Halovalidus salilacus TaxID=3075124 RepID=UPI00361A8CCF
MTFRDILEDRTRRELSLTVYASTPQSDLVDRLELRSASVDERVLPACGSDGFLVVREGGDFVTALDLEGVRSFLDPPRCPPWDDALVTVDYAIVLETFDDALWMNLERSQLVATTRIIENKAARVGEGVLRAGLGRLSALYVRTPIYERLASETDLEIHAYGRPDWDPPRISGTTVHPVDDDGGPEGGRDADAGGDELGTDADWNGDRTADGEIGRYRFVTYDGGSNEQQACALLAERRGENSYAGFWTFDPAVVDELETYVERTYG